MKKFITLLSLFLLIGITSQADSITTKAKEMAETAVNTADSAITAVDTSSTFKTFYNDLKSGVGALASSLKIGATEVFKILVKQQLVQSISWLLVIIVLLGLGFYALSCGKKRVDAANSKRTQDENYGRNYSIGDVQFLEYMIASIFLIGGGLGMLCMLCTNIVTGFVNPEYGAIMDIMSMIKKF